MSCDPGMIYIYPKTFYWQYSSFFPVTILEQYAEDEMRLSIEERCELSSRLTDAVLICPCYVVPAYCQHQMDITTK